MTGHMSVTGKSVLLVSRIKNIYCHVLDVHDYKMGYGLDDWIY